MLLKHLNQTKPKRRLVKQSLLYALALPMQSCQRSHPHSADALNIPGVFPSQHTCHQRRLAPHNRSRPCRFTLLSSVICTRITSWVYLLAVKRLTSTFNPMNQRKTNGTSLMRNSFTADPLKRVTRCKPWSSYCLIRRRWAPAPQSNSWI